MISFGTDGNVLYIHKLAVVYFTEKEPLKAVDDVSFSVGRGETVGLVGESGSGKSTIALAILGLLGKYGRVTGGEVWFRGENILEKTRSELQKIRGKRISIVFQDPSTSLNPSLTVGDQIAETINTHRKEYSKKEVRDIVLSLLARVEIPEPSLVAKRYPHQLSGGMQQRILIANAISTNPDLIILDEPTTALDVTIEAGILDVLESIKEEFRSSMLFITHNFGLVSRICDRTVVMYAGRKLESARTKDLLTKPLHPYTKGLLACIPDINAKNPAEILCNIPGRVPDLRSPPVGCVFSPRCECAKHECSANRPKSILVEWEHETACPCFLETSKKEGLETLQSSLKTPKAENTVLLNVDNLKKSFRHETLFGSSKKIIHAVDGVTFSVMRGETFGLVGESGCGKSTLGKCIVMLLPVDGGQVVYAGRSVTALSEKLMRPFRKEMQIIFQNPDSSLNPQKRIHQIIGRPLEIFEIAEGDKKEQRIYELLDLVELPNNYYSRYPHELSGGEKQRVGIARALASEPKFIVCDEPVTSLDLSVQASILNLLKKFQNDLGISHLLISHDLSVVKHISKKIAVMYMGVFCEVGTTEQIFAPPYHPYTYCLLSSVPLIEKDNGKQRARRLRLIGVPFFRVSGKGCVFAARCPLKIGQICEEVNPPTRTCNQGHLITCHKTIEELSMLERLIW